MKAFMKSMWVIVAVLMFFSLAAATANAADKKIVVGFSQIGAESAWRVANTESIISEAKKYSHIDLNGLENQLLPEVLPGLHQRQQHLQR